MLLRMIIGFVLYPLISYQKQEKQKIQSFLEMSLIDGNDCMSKINLITYLALACLTHDRRDVNYDY